VGGSEPKTPQLAVRAMAALAAPASPLTSGAAQPAPRPHFAPAAPLHPESSPALFGNDFPEEPDPFTICPAGEGTAFPNPNQW
jgi:hypothetical protein